MEEITITRKELMNACADVTVKLNKKGLDGLMMLPITLAFMELIAHLFMEDSAEESLKKAMEE